MSDLLAAVTSPGIAFDNAAIGMALVGLDGRYLRVNGAFCEFLGRSEEELLGTRWQNVTHTDDVGAGEREVAKTLAGEEQTFRLAKRYLRGDGRLVWGLLSVSLIRSPRGDPITLFTQVVDITEQREAEDELARVASIVEYSDDAVLSKRLDGTILTWNRGAEEMYGYTAAEMVGQSIFVLVPADRVDEVRAFLEAVRGGESVRNRETARLRKDGSLVDVSVTISPIRDVAGLVTGASTIARDITEQKRMGAELDATLEALERALSEARSAEARSRRFLSDAAHHLRNPVAAIRACAETLLRESTAAQREVLLASMARETARVSRLVDRLLRLTRLEQGERLASVRCDLVEICQDEVERARSLAPYLMITLTTDAPRSVNADPVAIREIIGNLLDNARRHAVRRIELTLDATPDSFAIHVIDDWPGLARGPCRACLRALCQP